MFKRIVNFFLVLFILLPVFSICQNQPKIDKKDDIIPLLCHTWNIPSRIDSAIKQYPPAESYSTIEFTPQGEVILKVATTLKGKWQYNDTLSAVLIQINNTVLKLTRIQFAGKKIYFEKNEKNQLLKEGFFWNAGL